MDMDAENRCIECYSPVTDRDLIVQNNGDLICVACISGEDVDTIEEFYETDKWRCGKKYSHEYLTSNK